MNFHALTMKYKDLKNVQLFCKVEHFCTSLENKHIEFIADNVDHNLRTIDGFNTIHAMGMIATVTPGIKNKLIIPRSSPKLSEIKSVGHINIKNFMIDQNKLSKLTYQTYHLPNVHNEDDNVNFLWNLSSLISPNTPSWSCKMFLKTWTLFALVHHFCFYQLSILIQVMYLASIPPFPISDIAMKYDKTPILTFDQPLWLKATQIIESSSSK